MKLTDEELEKIDSFLLLVEKTTFPQKLDMVMKLLVGIAKLFSGLHEESLQDVERLEKEKRMLLDACSERFARICTLTEENKRLKKNKEQLVVKEMKLTKEKRLYWADHCTFLIENQIANAVLSTDELTDLANSELVLSMEVDQLRKEVQGLKSQLNDALKTYESIIECATTTLYYFNGPNRRGGLIEIKKCAKEAIQRIKGEKRDEAKETNNHRN